MTVRGKSGQGSPGVRHGLLRGAVRLEMETQPTMKDGRAKTSDPDRDGAQVGRSPWVECLCVAGGRTWDTTLSRVCVCHRGTLVCVSGTRVCVGGTLVCACVAGGTRVCVCVAGGMGHTWDMILRAVGFPRILSRAARPLR